MHEPQLVPHFRLACRAASRASSLPRQSVRQPEMAISVTLKQVHTCLPRCFAASAISTGAFEPGTNSSRP
jgi:hypothetical protein